MLVTVTDQKCYFWTQGMSKRRNLLLSPFPKFYYKTKLFLLNELTQSSQAGWLAVGVKADCLTRDLGL